LKLLIVNHNSLRYEFRLLEQSGVVQVTKETNQSYRPNYTIEVRNGYFACDCPGAKYHKKCWHLTMIPKLFAQPVCTEPLSDWVEEAGLITYRR
jgi:hypothetical protein